MRTDRVARSTMTTGQGARHLGSSLAPATDKSLPAGASCASSLPARAAVVTTRLAQSHRCGTTTEVGAGARDLCGRRAMRGRERDVVHARECARSPIQSRRSWPRAAHDVAVTMSRQEYPDEKSVCDYPQPCGHRLSGDLSGFGALASERRCVTGINRADSASEKFCPTICAGPGDSWTRRSTDPHPVAPCTPRFSIGPQVPIASSTRTHHAGRPVLSLRDGRVDGRNSPVVEVNRGLNEAPICR